MVPVSVSVVIPCFRCAGTIAAAIASARNQTAQALEVIAVDDASDDETAAALSALRSQYGESWLKVIRLPRNSGPASARNAGWDAAKGDYIAFLDADDTWHPRKLEIQHAYMAAHPETSLCAHRSMLTPRGKELGGEPSNPAVRLPSPRSFLFFNPFVTPSVMIRRDLPYRFKSGRRHMEDHLLWQTMALSGERIAILDSVLAAIHKAPYGAGGLSAELWAMEKGELDNYRQLHRQGLISLPAAFAFRLFSLLKLVRRLIVVALRRLSRRA